MSENLNPFVYAVYDRINSGKGIKPVSLHYSEKGADEFVAERRKGLEPHVAKYIYQELFEIKP